MMKTLRILLVVFCFAFFGNNIFGKNTTYNPLDSIGYIEKNGKIFIKHQVDAGQTLYAISRKYKIDVNEIRNANENWSDNLKVNQVILVPCNYCKVTDKVNVAEVPRAEPKPQPSKEVPVINEEGFHTVRGGETLNKIAGMYGISVEDLKKLNGLNDNNIQIGQKLKVTIKGSSTPPNVTVPTEEKPIDNNPNKVEAPSVTPATKRNIDNGQVEETGTVEIVDEEDINSRSYAFHPSIPVGTLLMVTNVENNRSMFVRITGKYKPNGNSYILKVTPSIAKKLNLEAGKTRIKLSYTPD